MIFISIYLNRISRYLLKIVDDDVAEDVKSSFLESVDKVNERAGRARVLDEEQHLRSPEFDVSFARVQQ
jgi:hypothetical protein